MSEHVFTGRTITGRSPDDFKKPVKSSMKSKKFSPDGTFTGQSAASGEKTKQNQQHFHRTISPPKGGHRFRPVIPPGEQVRRASIASLVCCRGCKNHTGYECNLNIDEVSLCLYCGEFKIGCVFTCDKPKWGKIMKDEGHYCLEFKSRSTGPAKVRCADCTSINYHSGPPESLSCSHSLSVDMSSLTTASRCCALFTSRHTAVDPCASRQERP